MINDITGVYIKAGFSRATKIFSGSNNKKWNFKFKVNWMSTNMLTSIIAKFSMNKINTIWKECVG